MRLALAALATALSLAACRDAVIPTTPALRSASAVNPGQSHFSANGQFRSNRQKYRDAGQQPATGRSGAASLTARALLGRSGMTSTELTTGELDGGASPGTISKVQIKTFGSGNQLLLTQNYNNLTGGGSADYALPGMVRGNTVQVQAHVRGIAGSRTDVVTVTETVKLRPDLRASDLAAPTQAKRIMRVNISASVSEINGDVGARADCVLYVDGAPVDRADGIWVDAGDLVSCAFSHSFATTGTKALEVRVERVVPGDDDPTNNVVTGEINIVADATPIGYYAFAADKHDFSDWNRNSRILYNGILNYTDDAKSYSDQYSQTAYISAFMSNPISFPVKRLEVSQSTAGAIVHSAVYDDLAASRTDDEGWYVQTCAERYSGGYTVSVCSLTYVWGQTQSSVFYQRNASTTTYISYQRARQFNPDGAMTYEYYYWNNSGTTTQGEGFIGYGPTYSLSVQFDTDDRSYSANATVPLTPIASTSGSSNDCNINDVSPWRYINCYVTSWLHTGVEGSTYFYP